MKYKLFTYLLLCVCSLSAQTMQLTDLEKARLITLAEIENTNRLLQENTKITSNALNRLNLLVQQIDSRKKMINILNQEISSIDIEIFSKERQIKSLEKDLETKKQHYATSVRKMYSHKNNQDNLLFILSSKNFSQSFHRVMYLKAYSGWQKKQSEEIVEKQNTINQERNRLVAHRSEKYKDKAEVNMNWQYTDFKPASNNRLFPMKMAMELTVPKDLITLNLTFNSVDIDTDFKLDTTIPNGYQSIEIEQIIKLMQSF